MKIIVAVFFLILSLLLHDTQSADPQDKVRIAVAGLSHDHVHWLFGSEDSDQFEIVGIYDSNRDLHERYAGEYNLDEDLFYTSLEQMLDDVQPDAVTAFGSTYDHLAVVEAGAPRDIHIMVEKPLSVNTEHATRMRDLADQHDVHLITNYETTWYASNHEAYRLAKDEKMFGEIRKIVVHDGHRGPKEIGVSDEFLEWLTDPVLNGGGAIMDFGCYGANLMTWLMDGMEPLSVSAVTQTHKPDMYGEVDDEATIILTYPGVQGIIQASWNWPYNRKDMHIYGETGYVYASDDVSLKLMENVNAETETLTLAPREQPLNDPFSYFAEVVRGNVIVEDNDLSSLKNNMTVMRILDAARKSAETGETIYLD